MTEIVQSTLNFFGQNTPPLRTIVLHGPPGFAWALTCLYLAGHLKKRKGWRTGYTRKVFHFLIFFSVAMIQWLAGTPSVCLFGGMTTLVVFLGVLLGPGNILYEAMAREKDEPHRTLYVIVPYFATLFGGIISNVLFGSMAVVGYLVTGLGDAIGEPVGTRFGRHTYHAPAWGGVGAMRSLEGSAAVMLMSMLALIIGIGLDPTLTLSASSVWRIPLLGLVCAGVEAVSPHGWDNATLMIASTALVWWMW